MTIPRSILFVDGENLTMRFQDMVNAGFTPHEEVLHTPDVFVWHREFTRYHQLQRVIRVCYYTSLVGDDVALKRARQEISAVKYFSDTEHGRTSGQLVPVALSGTTGNLDTHVFLHGEESDENMGHLLLSSANTCYLHALLGAALQPDITLLHNGVPA